MLTARKTMPKIRKMSRNRIDLILCYNRGAVNIEIQRWQLEQISLVVEQEGILTTQEQNLAHFGDLVKHRPTAKPKILIQMARAPKKYTIPAATLPMPSPPSVSDTTLKFLANKAP